MVAGAFHSESSRIVGVSGTGGRSSDARLSLTASMNRARRISLRALPARSHAISFAHARLSAGSKGATGQRRMRNSIGRAEEDAR
jgi:hypothetical protein